MPKIDITKATVRTSSIYPAEFQHAVRGREKMALGNLAGLTQFGVNLTRLKPGAASALRHWHEAEDEFVFVIDGELTLIEDGGATTLKAGDAAGFKAGVPNGHHLINRSARDAVYLEVGTRSPREHAHYPDDDLDLVVDHGKVTMTRKSGAPIPDKS
jgi:uncharacterized cupin superfamily protein